MLKLNQPLITITNFAKLTFTRYFRINLMGNKLSDIFNYLKLDEKITTGGQPTVQQIELIRDTKHQVVINLALNTSENALANEKEVVESLGMKYVHIPIEFSQPKVTDFESFRGAMQLHQEQKIFIHCAANLRVSAFMYIYRILEQKIDPNQAKEDLYKLWQPNPTWQALIEQIIIYH